MRKSKRKYVPRLKVWKLKEESVKSEFTEMVAARAGEVSQASDVNGKWEAMKNVWLKTTEEV